MKNIIFSFMCFLLISCSDNTLLDVYKCSTKSNAQLCAATGKPQGCLSNGKTANFIVNIDRSEVLINGNLQKNCKVVDKKNWSCEVIYPSSIFNQFMKNEKWFSIQDIRNNKNRNDDPGSYYCGL
ncbi:hypothetical protein PQZ09_02955, partial [Methylophilaceae bacterium]|jgi:hypothetical protein|nr:hypothetical protein [Methylophilaceae bacterium]